MNGAPWVILGERNRTARIISFLDNLPEGNVAIVAGAGEDAARLQLEVGDETASGINRREIFVDAADCTTEESMQAAGQEALEDAKYTNIEMELIRQDMYGRDFTLGDIISADMGDYGAYALRVSEVETIYSAYKKQIRVSVGAELKDVIRVIRDATNTPSRRK